MYSRQNDRGRDFRIPRNYNGNVIFSSPDKDIPTKQHSAKDQPPRKRYADSTEKPYNYSDQDSLIDTPEEDTSGLENQEIEFVEPDDAEKPKEIPEAKSASLLSPIGALGTEEILLIALALIIFQGGKEPELALLLLALLFIN